MPKTNHANADLQDKGRAAFLSFCFKGRIGSFNFLTKKKPFRRSQENFNALSPTNQDRKRPKPALRKLI
jgi:hypothetical protein